jgi:two-component system cell cycle response regulator DivK
MALGVHAARAMSSHLRSSGAGQRETSVESDAGNGKAEIDQAARLVLIVDDFEDSRAMYSAYARVCGFEVAEAADGISALEQARRLIPHCIVIDLALPGLDGWEVVRRLRADPSTRHIPVIAVSGHTLESHTRAAQEAGCDEFLAKPCLPDALIDRIRKVLEARGPRGNA